MQIAMIDDKILPFDELDAAYFDRGLYFGDGIYEVLRSYDGKIFAIDEHLHRFTNGLAAIEIEGVNIETIRSRIKTAFEKCHIANAKIYFHITRGSAERNHICAANLKPNFFLTITKLTNDSETKREGIAVSTHPDLRWKRCDIKSLNLLANVLARRDAAKKGCDEAILVNESGFITEGASSSFFALFGKTLQTTPLAANILPSVTRGFVIKAAKNIGLKLKEESLTPTQAICADELFIAVTTKGAVPVIKFDGNAIGGSKPGKYTKLLDQELCLFMK